MKVYKGVNELVGNTPLVEIDSIEKDENLLAKIFVKLEYLNPAGSIKDRVALHLIEQAEKSGKLKKGGTVIEPTSGNTGIGLGAICAKKGYNLILTMPETMSEERRKLLRAYGAKVVLTDGAKGMEGAVREAERLNAEIDDSIIIGQFDNPSNPQTHYLTTGKEIYQDTDGKIDILVAGIGTGGTISGAGKYLKEKNQKIQIVGYEPESSPLITKGCARAHKIQGIGANFVPKNFDKKVVDIIKTVSDKDAYEYARILARKEGIFVGISSGGAVKCAVDLAKQKENEGKIIVAILPDSGDRYLSTDLY